MDKIKITEIKSNIKVKVISKEESSKLEKELDSDSFPEVSSSNDSNTNSFVPLIEQSEVVSQSEGEELVRPKREEDTPQFAESARYDTNVSRVNMSEGRIRYESSNGAMERVDPSLVRGSSMGSQSQGIGFRNDELERIQGHEKNYSAQMDLVKDNKIKSLRPWEV